MPILAFRTIADAAYRMDGGSISLRLRDEDEREHELLLARPIQSTPNCQIGRLYLDNRLIELRSPEEAAILAFLEVAPTTTPEEHRQTPPVVACIGDDLNAYFAAVQEGPAAAIRYLTRQILAFVRSDEYVRPGA